MNKISLIPLALAVSLVAGCASNSPYAELRNNVDKHLYDKAVRPVHKGTSWDGGNFRNQMANHVVNPKAHMANPRGKKYYSGHHRYNSNLPRYHVTSEEQAKYHELNSRLKNRMTNMRQQDIKSEATKNTSTVPAFTTTPSGVTPTSSGSTAGSMTVSTPATSTSAPSTGNPSAPMTGSGTR